MPPMPTYPGQERPLTSLLEEALYHVRRCGGENQADAEAAEWRLVAALTKAREDEAVRAALLGQRPAARGDQLEAIGAFDAAFRGGTPA